MDAGLTLAKLIGPIAAATVITAFWFAAMWRGHQLERNGGSLPLSYQAAFFGYLAVAGLIFYLTRDRPLVTGLDLFGAALVSEGLGIVITYGLVHAFVLSRGQPWSERATPMFFAILLTGGMFAAVLMA